MEKEKETIKTTVTWSVTLEFPKEQATDEIYDTQERMVEMAKDILLEDGLLRTGFVTECEDDKYEE